MNLLTFKEWKQREIRAESFTYGETLLEAYENIKHRDFKKQYNEYLKENKVKNLERII